MNDMESIMAVEAKLENILSCEDIPIVRLIQYEINAFVMGHHVYKSNWTPQWEMNFKVSWSQQI